MIQGGDPTGTGMGGDIEVTLEVKDGALTVVEIGPNNETQGIGGYEAIEDGTYAAQIEAKQDADVDVVSGATITSKAAEEDKPQPAGTSEQVARSKPRNGPPASS